MDLQLQGRSVVVTGAGSNIGRAVALAFASEAAALTLADIDEHQTRRVVELAGDSGAADAQFVRTDVTDLAAAEAMMAAADERYGSVDVLVNCVGWDQMMFFTETTPELWDKIIRLNYVGRAQLHEGRALLHGRSAARLDRVDLVRCQPPG